MNDTATGVWYEPADRTIRRLEAENEKLRALASHPRCDVCCCELSPCGPLDSNGPTLDCLVCQLRAESSHQCAAEWRDKYLAAQAIVDALSKTADGVPVVPGMKLYCAGEWWCVLSISTTGTLELSCWDDGMLRRATFGRRCYSTREAAEAGGDDVR